MHSILLDEAVIREVIEGQVYQSTLFDVGLALAKALSGDRETETVSPRISMRWEKDCLYLLRSRVKCGYLLLHGSVMLDVPQVSGKKEQLGDILHVFQRLCRFALKRWQNLALSNPSEQWLADQSLGIVFPFPKSKSTGFRVSLVNALTNERVQVRHGSNILYAYAAGTSHSRLTADRERDYKTAFEGLTDVRSQVEPQVANAEKVPDDTGYHPLVLRHTPATPIAYQSYDRWLSRLTREQKDFVTAASQLPQRVEGPAGTGKTLCLMLRAHFISQQAAARNEESHILFVAHSQETRSAIEILLSSVCGDSYLKGKGKAMQSIEVYTLQEWCAGFIGQREVSSAQYLDQDAMESKRLRKDFLKDIILKMRADNSRAFAYLSDECRLFFKEESVEYVAELLQHEIGVMIKGRASEQLENYLAIPRVQYGLPTVIERDRRFVFTIYTEYQDVLRQYGSFDTDDIVLTAIGSLDTPIWRRRRPFEGYDAVIIDETHLFNLNELSVFHMITRKPDCPRIIFSIDRSQAPGERGITTSMVREVLSPGTSSDADASTRLIFRCSPPVARLAEAVTAAGASLFTTFENPLVDYTALATAEDEESTEVPIYWECSNDAEMISHVLQRQAALRRELRCPAKEVLIIGSTESIIAEIRGAATAAGQRFVEILRRGDLTVVQREKEDAVVLSHPDFVGGLEFRAVLIVGADDGRIPLSEGAQREESRHFLEFRACNQLYVAITRGRSRVELFRSKERARSSLLEHAIATEVLVPRSTGAVT